MTKTNALKEAFLEGYRKGWHDSSNYMWLHPPVTLWREAFYRWSHTNEYRALSKMIRQAEAPANQKEERKG